MEEKIVLPITEELINQVAETTIGRTLTKKEMVVVSEEIQLGNTIFIDALGEIMTDAIETLKLERKCEKAALLPVRYDVYWKDSSAFQEEYLGVFCAKNESDARRYIEKQLMNEFVYYKIIKAEKEKQTEIAVIRNKYFHTDFDTSSAF